jgi:O-antigen/teichoic acid export membrane protein
MSSVAVGNLLPIVTLPILTRRLTTEDYGALALANAYALFATEVSRSGLSIAYERNFFAYRQGRQPAQLLYSVLAFTALAFLATGLLTWSYRLPVTEWLIGDPRYQMVLFCSFCFAAVAALKAYYLTYLRNNEDARSFTSYTVSERILAAFLSVGLVAGAQIGPVGLVLGQLLASLAVFLVVHRRFLRDLPLAFDVGLLADSLKLGYPLIPRTFLSVLGKNIDKYLIGRLQSLGDVGIYSIGQSVSNVAFVYMTALQNVFGPQVYERMFTGGPTAGRWIGRYLTPFAYISTLVAFLIAQFSEEVIGLLVAPIYAGAVPIVSVLVMYYAVLFFGKMPQITYARKTYLVPWLAVLGAVFNVAFGAAGVWMWGTIGAAWGLFAAGAAITAVTFVVAQRCFRIEWESRKLVAVFGLFIASTVLTIMLREAMLPFIVRFAAKMLTTAAFIWLGVRLQVITRQNLSLVRDLVLRRGSDMVARP